MEEKKDVYFDPLDMNNYRVEKLPKMEKSGFEKWLARLGGPLAIIAFILLYYFINISFLDNLNPDTLTGGAVKRLAELGLDISHVLIMPWLLFL